MSERIAYQHNRDHILKFAGMEKLTGEQVTDELNRLYTDNAELKEKIAALERKVETWIPVSERLLDAYAQISKGAERMSNRDCKHGQLARSCNICALEEEVNEKAETIAALEREVEALRSLLSDVTCVAITMLYDTHKQDVLDEFPMDDLKEVVRRSEHLQIEKVEHIYRRGFEALAGGEAG